jgi:RNA polymerase sigma-70 factor (ECF subfamily)
MTFLAGRLGGTPDREAATIALARQRDRNVWAGWHDEYYPVLYRYAYSRLANASDAEDIASQVFLEALEGIDRYEHRGRPILAWLYGIARHLVSRRIRQRGRSAPLELVVDFGEDADELSEDKIEIYDALDKLKAEHSEVLILRYLLDLPLREVAEILGKSEQATYSLQVRALTAMRSVLKKAA